MSKKAKRRKGNLAQFGEAIQTNDERETNQKDFIRRVRSKTASQYGGNSLPEVFKSAEPKEPDPFPEPGHYQILRVEKVDMNAAGRSYALTVQTPAGPVGVRVDIDGPTSFRSSSSDEGLQALILKVGEAVVAALTTRSL